VRLSTFYASEPCGATFAQLLAACVDDESGAAYFREYFLAGRHRVIAQLWQRALDRGEADPAIELAEVVDILAEPLIFRRLTGHHSLTEDAARRIVHAVLRGLARHDMPPNPSQHYTAAAPSQLIAGRHEEPEPGAAG
jgi:hypothetical protein